METLPDRGGRTVGRKEEYARLMRVEEDKSERICVFEVRATNLQHTVRIDQCAAVQHSQIKGFDFLVFHMSSTRYACNLM